MNVEKKIIDKPWGHEIIWAHTDRYVGKILFIESGHQLSRQFHEIKEETILVLSGTLKLEVGSGETLNISYLQEGSAFHIMPGLIHRFCATKTDVKLAEVSTPEINDVIRLEDDYNRTN